MEQELSAVIHNCFVTDMAHLLRFFFLAFGLSRLGGIALASRRASTERTSLATKTTVI
jgi:hypothetical protein